MKMKIDIGFIAKGVTILGLVIFLFLPLGTSAHPGNTASDGCHYCRTNCDSWGVAWNQRHCHNGEVASDTSSENNNWIWWFLGGGSVVYLIWQANKNN